MSEQVATAQPAAPSAPEANPVPVTQAQIDLAKTPDRSLDDILSEVYDKNTAPAKAAPVVEPAAQEAENTDQPEAAASEPASSSSAIAAPHAWSAEAKAEWGKLPPNVQTYIAQRESEAHKAITQSGNELKTYQPLRQALDQFREFYPPGQEAQFVNALMQANAALHKDPIGTLRQLAEYYNVDPARIAGQQPAQQQTSDVSGVDDLFRDTRLDRDVMPKVQTMQERLRQLESHITVRSQQEAAERHNSANTIITEFSKDKPDFSDLQDEIAREAQILRQENPRISMEKLLEQAYDRARWANPTHRQRILDEERKTAEDKAQKEAAKKQAEAKKHASMNVRTGASASTPTVTGKMLDSSQLSALYDRIASR